jgi:hypothetical protein
VRFEILKAVSQVGRSQVRVPMRSFNFLIYLILPGYYGPRVYSTSSRNEYQKVFPGSRARPANKDNNFTAIYELFLVCKF